MNMIGFTVIGAISLVIDTVTENTLGKWQKKQLPTSATFVSQIDGDMAKGPVTPSKLLEYSAATNPRIQGAIRQVFHADYATLSFKQKQQAITMLGQDTVLGNIANDLNNDRIRPSELPFLLSGMDSPSRKFAAYIKKVGNDAAEQKPAQPKPLNDMPVAKINEIEQQGQIHEGQPARVLH